MGRPAAEEPSGTIKTAAPHRMEQAGSMTNRWAREGGRRGGRFAIVTRPGAGPGPGNLVIDATFPDERKSRCGNALARGAEPVVLQLIRRIASIERGGKC
jgi:hypothetical protein